MHDSVNLSVFEPKENRIIYDWISFTTRLHTVFDLIDLLGFSGLPFEQVSGSKGYRYRMYFGGISIHFNDEHDKNNSFVNDFIWLEMSGQGCRTFETFSCVSYEYLFDLVRNNPDDIHLTRVDIAFDDVKGLLNIDQICEKVKNEEFTARTSKYECIYSNGGNAVYFGSKKSNIFIRIYDKAKERGFSNGLHWIRAELQIKDDNANGFVKELRHQDIKELYLGILRNYINFREPTDDTNKRRWPISPFWSDLLNDALAISIYDKPGVEYNLSACERYVFTQPIGSIKALIQIYGKNEFFDMIRQAPNSKNPKYKMLVNEYRTLAREYGEIPKDKDFSIESDAELYYLSELRSAYYNAQKDLHDKEALKEAYKKVLEEHFN